MSSKARKMKGACCYPEALLNTLRQQILLF